MKEPKVIYYSDEGTDDFARTNINTKKIDKDFAFVNRNIFWRIASFLAYYVVALPIVYVVAKVFLGLKIKNRKAVRRLVLSRRGFFLYGNHTQMLDAFVPPMAAYPAKAYTIANADAVSIKGLRQLVLMLGGLPIPNTVSAMPEFIRSVETRWKQRGCVSIYPEAHIWPFYTKIRNFSTVSFRYPARLNAPVLAMVTTYRKRRGLYRLFGRPAMTVTISDPIEPDEKLSVKEKMEYLRNEVYRFMTEVSEREENVEYIKYVRRTPEGDEAARVEA